MRNCWLLAVLLVIIICHSSKSFSQGIRVDQKGVAINYDDSSPDTSAVLDIKSTTRGLLIPRLSTVQRDSILGPTTGLMVFDTSLGQFCYYTGSGWKPIGSRLDASKIFVGNSDGFALARTISGDANIDSLGVITITSNAITSSKILDGNITAAKLNNMSASNGQILKYNGSSWAPGADNGTTYSAGTGIEITGTTITNTSPNVNHTGDVTGSGSLTIGNNAVTTVKISDNSVSGAKIAMGNDARGDILYYNGTDWARLGAGTSGYYLKTNGNNLDPSWASIAGDIDGVTAGNGLINGGTSGTVTLDVNAINGLTVNSDTIRLGGSLNQNTTLTQGSNSFTINNSGTANTTVNLSSTGDFDIQDNGTSKFFVSDAGNVGIGTNAPVSTFTVGGAGASTKYAYINSSLTNSGAVGLYVDALTPGSGSYWSYGIRAICSPSQGYACGLYGNSYSGSSTSGRAYGVYGVAGNASSGFNYGVYGYLYGSNNGAGVFGTTSGDVSVSGKWAGYFYGDVYVNSKLGINTTSPSYKLDVPNDTVRVKALVYSSDENLKENIMSLQSNFTSKLYQLNAKSYNLKPLPGTHPQPFLSDTVSINANNNVQGLNVNTINNKKSIGFIAQEVEQVFPDLVSMDNNGYYALDYISLIPIIVESVKEQKVIIDSQSQTINDLTNQIQLLNTKNIQIEAKLLELENRINNH